MRRKTEEKKKWRELNHSVSVKRKSLRRPTERQAARARRVPQPAPRRRRQPGHGEAEAKPRPSPRHRGRTPPRRSWRGRKPSVGLPPSARSSAEAGHGVTAESGPASSQNEAARLQPCVPRGRRPRRGAVAQPRGGRAGGRAGC